MSSIAKRRIFSVKAPLELNIQFLFLFQLKAAAKKSFSTKKPLKVRNELTKTAVQASRKNIETEEKFLTKSYSHCKCHVPPHQELIF